MNKHQIRISLKKGLENDQFSYLGPPNEKIDHKAIIYGQNRGHETRFISWFDQFYNFNNPLDEHPIILNDNPPPPSPWPPLDTPLRPNQQPCNPPSRVTE